MDERIGLGARVKDKLTGFAGEIDAEINYNNGELKQYRVVSPFTGETKPIACEWIICTRLELY